MDAVLFSVQDKVATITLNRPDKYNAINRAMALGVQDRLREAELSDDVRCIVLTGAGRAFCSGQDLTEVKDPHGEEMKRILPEHLNPIVQKLRTIQKPVLGVVNGIAAGAGANIVLCCDIVLAGESAYFTQAFSKIGLIPDSGGTYVLPRLVGLQKAIGMMMLAEKIYGPDAEAMGMIYKCFPDERLFVEAEKIAKILAGMPTKALVYTRMAVEESMNATFGQQLANEAKWQSKAAATEDFIEGVKAFLQKRIPVFQGK